MSAVSNAKHKVRILSTSTQFLARLSQHIPNRYESIVRYYGAWSYRYRGEQKKKAPQEIEIQPVPEEFSKKKASRAWAALIKKVYEVDPLVCPRCGEQMKIVEFPKNSKDILALCESLKIPKFKAPSPLRAPPESYLVDPELDVENENQEYWSE